MGRMSQSHLLLGCIDIACHMCKGLGSENSLALRDGKEVMVGII